MLPTPPAWSHSCVMFRCPHPRAPRLAHTRSLADTGRPRFVRFALLRFTDVLCNKLKARPSNNKKIMTPVILLLALWQWSGPKPALSRGIERKMVELGVERNGLSSLGRHFISHGVLLWGFQSGCSSLACLSLPACELGISLACFTWPGMRQEVIKISYIRGNPVKGTATHFITQEPCLFKNLLPRPVTSFLLSLPSLTRKPSLICPAFSPSCRGTRSAG